jgi:hypothetical protein
VGYPDGREFAFTILDDTDDATLENIKPIYDLLSSLNMRTTKTAWPLDCPEGSRRFFAGETLADPTYREFVAQLGEQGFELACHGATMEPSDRERTLRGIREFRDLLGVNPTLYCNHAQNIENLYWGAERYRTKIIQWPLKLVERFRKSPKYSGHVEDSSYFWGDVCLSQFRYVRSFAFASLNSGAIVPRGPYKLRDTRWVNYWFNTADAPDAESFKRLVTRQAIDRLCAEGGSSIISTHLGKGFVRNGRVDPGIESILRYVASLNGWFVPASTLLDHLMGESKGATLATGARCRLEVSHILDRLRAKWRFGLTDI